ncbi:Uncharacterised protein [Vibrio cholerae]|uniref:Uncharacterized protein n=1 Tax=Vibrio cholerae TaxID=666 RepID=A0A655SX37_VIBCL|nr:Uncharacterised protein [Vibrio cholerae]CSA64778.1 Uncharacterised protein [Vibrio cholerae]CSA72890.1 Uncharacterised protein [Vibrio cholerae]CSB28246.1 Uncharacterised protein [Vibrio cholerae]CSB60464.1 Uncharacterised protein [Vibrio cholerae]
MVSAAVILVVTPHDELYVRVRFSNTGFDDVVLVVWVECVIQLHRTITTAQFRFGYPCPWVWMREDRAVLFHALVNASHETDVIIWRGK